MRTLWLSFVTVLLCALAMPLATAQVEKSSIAGVVKDSTNSVLPGARVEIQPNGPSAVSDGQGQFIIPNLSPATYTVSVSYVGFSPFTTSVTVVPGQVAHADAVLKIGTQSDVITV